MGRFQLLRVSKDPLQLEKNQIINLSKSDKNIPISLVQIDLEDINLIDANEKDTKTEIDLIDLDNSINSINEKETKDSKDSIENTIILTEEVIDLDLSDLPEVAETVPIKISTKKKILTIDLDNDPNLQPISNRINLDEDTENGEGTKRKNKEISLFDLDFVDLREENTAYASKEHIPINFA